MPTPGQVFNISLALSCSALFHKACLSVEDYTLGRVGPHGVLTDGSRTPLAVVAVTGPPGRRQSTAILSAQPGFRLLVHLFRYRMFSQGL